MSPAEIDEKRAKRLCFHYDEKYISRHICAKRRQLFSIWVVELEEEESGDEEILFDPSELLNMEGFSYAVDSNGTILPHVSVYATCYIRRFRVSTHRK